jgi:Nucleotidyltransferase domain
MARIVKHPALRVAAWHWIAPEYRKMIQDAIINDAVATLPFRPARVELVGSMVRGCAHLDSDIDLNLAAHDWNEQIVWRRLWKDQRHQRAFLDALASIANALSMRIEVAPNNPDQHTYDLCLDLLTNTLTNPLGVFPDLSARWWDGYQMKWRPRPLMARARVFATDEWAGSLARIIHEEE